MLVFAALLLTAAEPGALDIVKRSLEANERNWKIARNYTFIERSEARQLDSEGRVKSRRLRTHDITLLEGSPYRRLIERDDQPLSPDEERKEEEKLRKSIEERRKETEAQRAKRIADFEKRRRKEIELIGELPKAFDFRVVGEETVSGAEAWVLDATPRPGYEPRDRRARFFPKLKGRLWLSKQDYSWVKAEAEVIDTISFGLFVARLGKGARLRFEQVRVNDEVWLPSHIAVAASARVALLKKYNVEQDISYKRYRKFQSDSRIVSTEEIE
jgi:hypothetical protein